MSRHNFKKTLGQNFFRSSKWPKKLVESISVSSDDIIVEIGPGDGSVTRELLNKGAIVEAVEFDYDLIPKLIRSFNHYERFNLHHENILDFDLEAIFLKHPNKIIKVVGSLPYNISKAIIKKLTDFDRERRLLDLDGFDSMSFIVQEEVAKVYVSVPPKSTYLSNVIRLYGTIRKLETINQDQFEPRPKVKGAILKIVPSLLNRELDFVELKKMIKIGFVSPRKLLIKNLKSSNKYEQDLLNSSFQNLEIDLKVRPAELEFEKWVLLFKSLFKN